MVSQSKQKPPAFLLYARDFTSGTAHFSPAEVGAYMRCLCYQWECGGVPATDTVRLARIVGASVEETTALWDVICTKFRKQTDGLFWNPRLESVRSSNTPWISQKRVAGQARAAKAQRGQRGRFVPCNRSTSKACNTSLLDPAQNAVTSAAGAPLVLPLEAPLVVPLVDNPQNHSGILQSDQRTTSDPFPSPVPNVHSNRTSTSKVPASPIVLPVLNVRQRPDGRELTNRRTQTEPELSRQPASDGNYAVALKLVHTVLDEDASLTDIGMIADAVKWRCAQARIDYDSDLVTRAVASALTRRRLDQVAVTTRSHRRRA